MTLAPPVETVRIDERGKQHLISAKRRTGLKNWNVLCRWALCMSLAEDTQPAPLDEQAFSNVEMTWSTFAGKHADLYTALIAARCTQDGIEPSPENMAEVFRAHLQRGLLYLVGNDATRSLDGMLRLVV